MLRDGDHRGGDLRPAPSRRTGSSREGRSLLEVYTRVRSPEGEPLLFEAYYSAADIARAARAGLRRRSAGSPLGGLLGAGRGRHPAAVGADPPARAHRPGPGAAARAAADASEAERRRIARDLHDGVVQDLAGTSFALSAAARDAGTDPATAARLEPMAGVAARPACGRCARCWSRSTRPSLRRRRPRGGARATWSRTAAPAGVTPVVEVVRRRGRLRRRGARWSGGSPRRPCATRCGTRGAANLTVQVSARRATGCALDVSDDGVGFDPPRPAPRGHLGLRGLRDLVADGGGAARRRARRRGDGHDRARWRCRDDGRRRSGCVLVDDHAVRPRRVSSSCSTGSRRHRGGRQGGRRRRGARGRPTDRGPTSC